MEIFVLGLGITIHLVLVLFNLYDLFTKSKRHNKANWLMLISLVPFLGVMIYDLTKRRKKLNVRH